MSLTSVVVICTVKRVTKNHLVPNVRQKPNLNCVCVPESDCFDAFSFVYNSNTLIRLSRSGLRYHDRPIGVFLFMGRSGTGKTEAAKALSEVLFNTKDALTRVGALICGAQVTSSSLSPLSPSSLLPFIHSFTTLPLSAPRHERVHRAHCCFSSGGCATWVCGL